jgi:tyrosine aminotransferase
MYSTLVLDPKKFKDIDSSFEFAKKLQLEENVLVFPGEVK